MSREKVHEVSSPISLFPFIGILLCTMGALLVILVAVSRSAKDSAVQQVESQQQSGSLASNDAVVKQIDEVKQYVAKLNSVRGDGERELREEQQRLGHLEDHIRRMQEQSRSLILAAEELEALEKEHYDDRQQAEREVARLQQLIADSQKSIESLREVELKGKRSYALVPYEGPNGTFRRPIYIECREDKLILQPEGICITGDDLRPPYGAGNPLASAIRAARDHLVRIHPNEGQVRGTEPYPLLLVRPDGLMLFDRARRAIEAGDFDFGFELVESDWELKYPALDPKLAEIEQIAIEQALARQEVLAAAAPRAYRHPSASGSFSFEGEQEVAAQGVSGTYVVRRKQAGGDGDGMGDGGGGGDGTGDVLGGGDGKGGGVPSDDVLSGNGGRSGGGGSGEGGNGGGGGSGNGSGDDSGGNGGGGVAVSAYAQGGGASGGTGGNGGDPGNASGAQGQSAAGGNSNATGGSGGQFASGSGGPPPDGNAQTSISAGSNQDSSNINVVAGSQAGPSDGESGDAGYDPQSFDGRINPSTSRGKDWALRNKSARAVPVRRTIRVIIRDDRIAILPEGAPINANTPADNIIPLKGDTVQSLDDFVEQVREQIDSWGIAGNGLYWRPVLIFSVGPDGERRAQDLTRLLRNSGFELGANDMASNMSQGNTHETH